MEPAMNCTARWLCSNPSVRSVLVKHLSHKLVPSDQMGLIEEHVQGFLVRLIEADRLASHMGEGREVNIKALAPCPATQTAHTEPVNTNVVFQFDREEPTPEVDYCDPNTPNTLDTLCRETQAGFIARVLETTEHSICIPVLIGVLQGEDLMDLCTLFNVTPKQALVAARLVGRATRSQER